MRDEQPQRAGGTRQPRRAAWIAYWVVFWTLVLGVYPILTFVPALGGRRLVLGVTLRQSVGSAIDVLAGAVIAPYVLAQYYNAWRTLPAAWWRWAIVGGLVAAVAGLAGAGVVALFHTQVGDALGFPLYVSGICIAFAGIGAFGVGSIAMALATRRQHQGHVGAPRQVPPPIPGGR